MSVFPNEWLFSAETAIASTLSIAVPAPGPNVSWVLDGFLALVVVSGGNATFGSQIVLTDTSGFYTNFLLGRINCPNGPAASVATAEATLSGMGLVIPEGDGFTVAFTQVNVAGNACDLFIQGHLV